MHKLICPEIAHEMQKEGLKEVLCPQDSNTSFTIFSIWEVSIPAAMADPFSAVAAAASIIQDIQIGGVQVGTRIQRSTSRLKEHSHSRAAQIPQCEFTPEI
jgi:hypothetical protein